ncbi:hypothetical protein HPT25_27740 [Bacillus sp. BRMEA1]|uniref:hypothetical protein n=1 Tax=Neobacillus endophyticus TaxID=2738405 RepID=UPI001562F897|nr:hypothetical protein [Neobacillus endophyticus]NRD81089.1 hypothetical protein [Neobacillus endophyticus]
MSNFGFNYEYKQKEKKNGNSFVSVRDIGENSLLEVVKKGNTVEIITNIMNFKTTKFSLPLELFEKMYNDITKSNNNNI